jgi:hypothetical protein
LRKRVGREDWRGGSGINGKCSINCRCGHIVQVSILRCT